MVTPGTWYPHLLQLSVLGLSQQDADGNWVPGALTMVETPCRAEPGISVLDGLRQAADGKVLNYGWVIYMPSSAPLLPVGAEAVIKDQDSAIVASDTIKRFSRGQLNARAWL